MTGPAGMGGREHVEDADLMAADTGGRSPGEPLRVPVTDLVAQAMGEVTTVPLSRAAELLESDDVRFVDIREPGELRRLGMLPGAFRAPRGMLEFWVDPDSPYYKPELDDGRTLLLYCGSAWRSALAAKSLQDMGFDAVAHLEGGFSAWSEAGLPVEPHESTPGKSTPRKA